MPVTQGAPSELWAIARDPCEYINNKTLAVAGTAETETVPEGAALCVLGATADFTYRVGGAASSAPGDKTDGSGSGVSPAVFRVVPGQEISVVSATAGCIIGFEYYGKL